MDNLGELNFEKKNIKYSLGKKNKKENCVLWKDQF